MITITESFVKCFNEHKTGMSFYDDVLDPSQKDYMKFCKGIVGHIEKMTCDEYFERIGRDVFGHGAASARKGMDWDNIDEYAQKMKDGVVFNIPYINLHPYHGPSQEGRHRMLAMAKAFGEDAEGSVLIMEASDPTDKEIEAYAEKRWGKDHVDFGIRCVQGYLSQYNGKDMPIEDEDEEEPEEQVEEVQAIDLSRGDVVDFGDGWCKIIDMDLTSLKGIGFDTVRLSDQKDLEYEIYDFDTVKMKARGE